MRIAVFGAGAIGSYFGARLVLGGEEVHFIGRGSAHFKALSEKGLTILGAQGEVYIDRLITSTDPRSVGPVDMVLLCVKLWDLDSAAQQITPLLRQGTAVYPFQNGIYAESRLVELLGPEYIIGGYAATPVSIVEPGVIRQFAQRPTLGFGELDNSITERVKKFHLACQNAGIHSLIEPDVRAALWKKFIIITTHSGANSTCRSSVGPIRNDLWGRQLLIELSEEGTRVARAHAVAVPEDFSAYVLSQLDNLPPTAQGSMYTDLLRGARLELPWLNGWMVEMGKRVGIPTPYHRAVMMAVNLHAQGKQH